MRTFAHLHLLSAKVLLGIQDDTGLQTTNSFAQVDLLSNDMLASHEIEVSRMVFQAPFC